MHMKRSTVKELLTSTETNRDVLLKGWVRTRRGNNQVAFIAINDGLYKRIVGGRSVCVYVAAWSDRPNTTTLILKQIYVNSIGIKYVSLIDHDL